MDRNIAVKANTSENPKDRLTDEEMVSLIATFLLAGKETALCSLLSSSC